MTQKLYEDALADAKKVTEVAENAAKQAVLAAVVPRIKNLIEQELLGEDEVVGDDVLMDDPMLDDDMLGDDMLGAPDVVVKPGTDVAVADAITPPDEEGKITLDLDAMSVDNDEMSGEASVMDGDDEFELSLESTSLLKALKAGTVKNPSELKAGVKLVETALNKFSKSKRINEHESQIARMIQRVENMYGYVQESINDQKSKKAYEAQLESLFQKLTELQETAMSLTRKNRKLNEEEELDLDVDSGDESEEEVEGDGELTLKLTGLPDDVDLGDVGVDLVVDDDGEGDDELDLDVGDGDQGGDDLDLDMDMDMGDDQETQMESILKLSDNTVVEIDESMLRREIARMSKLREEHTPSTDANGHGQDSSSLDDFGGAHEEGEPILDVDVETDGAEPLGEMDEMEDMPMEMDMEEEGEMYQESRRRLVKEKRFQNSVKRRARALREAVRRAKGVRRAQLKAKYKKTVAAFTESYKRSRKLEKRLASLNEARKNRVSNRPSGRTDGKLRAKLAESNLNNVKLAYANKVLQSSMTKRQQAQVINRLDECKTSREAKLVYESVTKTLGSNRRPMNESVVRGSGSKVTATGGSSQRLDEGFETARWAKLAGITK